MRGGFAARSEPGTALPKLRTSTDSVRANVLSLFATLPASGVARTRKSDARECESANVWLVPKTILQFTERNSDNVEETLPG